MKRIAIIIAVIVAGFFAFVFIAPIVYRHHHPVHHQLPYKWDSYVQRDLEFEMEPMSNVIKAVNDAISETSGGQVPEAIKLDATPTRIVKVNSDQTLNEHMDQLIAEFRENEKEMLRKGARGFESTPYTGVIHGNHSLGCTLVMMGSDGLQWKPKEDALHVCRFPSEMECRAYRVNDVLIRTTEDWIAKGRTHAEPDWDPVCFVFVKMAKMQSWSIMVPSGPHSASGEFRLNKVTKHLPDMKVILALDTPERHEAAEEHLRQNDMWVEVSETQPTNPQVFSESAPSGTSSEKP